jgi:hypothetical protein
MFVVSGGLFQRAREGRAQEIRIWVHGWQRLEQSAVVQLVVDTRDREIGRMSSQTMSNFQAGLWSTMAANW